MTAGVLATCTVQSGYRGQVLDHLDLACSLLQMLEDLALGVDGVDGTIQQRRFQRAERQVVLVVTAHP